MSEHAVSLVCSVSIILLGFLAGLLTIGVLSPKRGVKKPNLESHTGAGKWHW